MVGRFVRHRNRVPHQVSSISASEQARLLNDPAVSLAEEPTAALANEPAEITTKIDQNEQTQRRVLQALVETSKAA